jgi:hypothetical protein
MRAVRVVKGADDVSLSVDSQRARCQRAWKINRFEIQRMRVDAVRFRRC